MQLQDGREEEKRRDREKEPSKRHVTLSLARPMKEAVLLRGVSNLYDCMKAAFSLPGNARSTILGVINLFAVVVCAVSKLCV